MTNEILEPLERLWHDVDPGLVPLSTIAGEGERQGRRRRRMWLAAAAASVALVVGASVLALGGSDHAGRDVQPTDGTELKTTVRTGVIGEVNASVDVFNGPVAVWDASRSSLLYVTAFGYSSTCLPTTHARTSPGGGVVLVIDRYAGAGICTADAVRATVRIQGIERPPLVMRVISDGKATDVMVQNRDPVVRPGRPNQALEVGESGPMMFAVHCGPGLVQMGDETWRTVGDGPLSNGLSQVLVGTGTRTSSDTLIFTSPDLSDPIVFHRASRAKPEVCY